VDCDAALEREPRGMADWSKPLAVGVTGLVGLLGDEGPGLLPSLVRFLLRKPRACINALRQRQPTECLGLSNWTGARPRREDR